MYYLPEQHGEFLSEHLAFVLNLQFSSQQASVSSDPKRPKFMKTNRNRISSKF